MRMVQGSRCSERRRAVLYVYLLMNVLRAVNGNGLHLTR
jgi:hypothetical protein